MVFDDRRDDDIVGGEPEPVREVVDRLGGVAADDRDVIAVGRPAREAQDRSAGASSYASVDARDL